MGGCGFGGVRFFFNIIIREFIANSSCGTTETLILKTNRSFGRPGGIKMFFLCKTC